MQKLLSLSIFFPCLNDGNMLPALLKKTYDIAPTVARRFEVIIIENGSTDETPQILTMLEGQYQHLRVVRFKKPLGYGGALQQGFAHAAKDWVFYTDGDGQYDPLELSRLVKKVRKNIDVVNGYKLRRGDAWYRVVLGSVYNWIIQICYHPPIRDIDCDFRLIRREKLQGIRLTATSAMAPLELVLCLKRAGARFAEVGVSHFPRAFGRSEFFRLGHLVGTLVDYWRYIRTHT